MSFNFKATVNYPGNEEADTPDFVARSEYDLMQLFINLIREDADATSFVITICKTP